MPDICYHRAKLATSTGDKLRTNSYNKVW